MNSLVRGLLRQVNGNFGAFSKQYHYATSGVMKSHLIAKPVFQNAESITRLIQKTIIPFNEVKPRPPILDKPCNLIIGKIDNSLPKKIDIEPVKEISDPSKMQEKKAHRMLIIRRKKMNRHKYKKLQKKLKAVFAKVKRERFAKKESAFKQGILNQLKEVQKFSAEEYVAAKLEMYRMPVITNRIHGKFMPRFAVLQYLERRQKFKQRIADKKLRKERFLAERGSLSVDVDADTKN